MALPFSIREADGSIVPFDSEQIAHSLFDVSSLLDKPNVLLARELADSVLHFLSLEETGEPLPRAELDELIVKVVRELGHPEIARSFAQWDQSPTSAQAQPAHFGLRNPRHERHEPRGFHEEAIKDQLLEDYVLQHVVPVDLAAAVRDGYLILSDAGHLSTFSARVFPQNGPLPADPWELLQRAAAARRSTCHAAIDGLDYSIAEHRFHGNEISTYLGRLATSFERAGLSGSVHLNCQQPPEWSHCYSADSLFAEQATVSREEVKAAADAICDEEIVGLDPVWHVADPDVAEAGSARLRRILRKMAAWRKGSIILDRPRRPVMLGSSLQRDGLACLAAVRLDLVRFLEILGGGPLSPDTFLKKLGSLARLARSAGYFRQDFFRKHPHPGLKAHEAENGYLEVVHNGLIASAFQVLGSRADEQDVVTFASRSLEAIRAGLQENQLRPIRVRLTWQPNRSETSIFWVLGEANSILSRQLRHAASFRLAPGNRIVSVPIAGKTMLENVLEVVHGGWRLGIERIHLDFC